MVTRRTPSAPSIVRTPNANKRQLVPAETHVPLALPDAILDRASRQLAAARGAVLKQAARLVDQPHLLAPQQL
eukprot:5316314-Prymnesium_polylepis.1